jgi:Protein of unknown function (DUF1553)/Protein of unknown function (DUF1549)/Planctomycete cytochrome C
MKKAHTFVLFACAIRLMVAPLTAVANEPNSEATDVEFFEKKIRPILVGHCYNCHSADTKPAGGLRVDDRNGLLTGGDTAAAVVPGDPEKSLLIQRVLSQNPKRRMPKEGELLTETEIAVLKTWIKNGAAWPREKIPVSFGHARPEYDKLRTNHWAWQPLTNPKVPIVSKVFWPNGDIDRFVLAKLEEKKLNPVPDADAVTLIRRVTYDLTGLPPTPAEVDAFVKDRSPDAFAKLVDRLLASPRFGERWGRHWLDVARYGESTGPSRNVPYPFAWKYRDYVIDAVNRDIPFDRFIQEQIAGDLLPAATPAERDRLLTATGFLALGVKDVNQRFKTRFIMDNVDEQIDVVTRSTLALTVSCARCHDHKYDPIPTKDYYALAGIFTSTDDCAGVRNKMGGGGLDYYNPAMLVKLTSYEAPKVPQEKVDKLQAEVDEAKKAWDEIRGTPEGLAPGPDGKPRQRPFRLKYERLQSDLLALTDPVAQGFAVHGVREAKTIGDTDIRIRGEAERIGPTVPRGFLSTFVVPDAPILNTNQSGRLELAHWLTSPKNPLVSRVIVNRIWKHLFGRGIVSTVDNFGTTGDVPANPELLDHLASTFIRDGWSTKKLIREIVLSHAYRLGSTVIDANQNIDPANQFVWRHSPRRLEAEEIRDAMLASSGRLQLQPPTGGSPAAQLKMIEMRDNGGESRAINESADHALYRSVYLPLLRGVVPKSLAAFDPVDQTLVSGQRESTTVPAQALYLLNATFVRQQSLAFAERVLSESGQTDAERIREAYRLSLGRIPNSMEIFRAKKFITQFQAAYQKLPTNEKSVEATASDPISTDTTDVKAESVIPPNPDDIDRTSQLAVEEVVQPKTPKLAAWMNFAQALYASAEFRFVR